MSSLPLDRVPPEEDADWLIEKHSTSEVYSSLTRGNEKLCICVLVCDRFDRF